MCVCVCVCVFARVRLRDCARLFRSIPHTLFAGVRVLVRARLQLSLVQLCVRRGVDAFLMKPINVNEIRHLWQYAKVQAFPDGSFKADIEAAQRAPAVPRPSIAPSAAATPALGPLSTLCSSPQLQPPCCQTRVWGAPPPQLHATPPTSSWLFV